MVLIINIDTADSLEGFYDIYACENVQVFKGMNSYILLVKEKDSELNGVKKFPNLKYFRMQSKGCYYLRFTDSCHVNVLDGGKLETIKVRQFLSS